MSVFLKKDLLWVVFSRDIKKKPAIFLGEGAVKVP